MISLDYYKVYQFVHEFNLKHCLTLFIDSRGLPEETIILTRIFDNVVWDTKTGEVLTIKRHGIE